MEFISRLALCLIALSELTVKCDLFIDNERDWKITFYTGSKIWSGTDSIINAQIYGSNGKSDIKQIIPKAPQMEAKSVDRFSIGPLDTKVIGNIESITVSKQHSYSFFNDWELIKVELTDPNRRTYLFNCNCWLTTLKYKQNIELYSIDGVRIQKHITDVKDLKRRSFSAFPVTVSLLLLFLMLIIFTYFGNLIATKWRENSAFITNNARRRHQRANNFRSRRTGRATTNYSRNLNAEDLYKDDDDDEDSSNTEHVYNVTNDLTNLNTNSNLNRSSHQSQQTNNAAQPTMVVSNLSNEDKPPDYKQLFPQQNIPMQKLSQAKDSDTDPNV